MKQLLALVLCAITVTNIIAQNTKEITQKGVINTEIYHIDKKTKNREGSYLKINNSSRDTLITGWYQNNNKTGVWKYNAVKNRPYLYYDYSNLQVLKFPRNISQIDSFLVKTDTAFTLSKIDRAPVYLGYISEMNDLITSEVKIPFSLLEKGKTGACLYTFVVDSTGKMTQINLEQPFDKEFDTNVLNALKRIDGAWLPAILQGKPVDSKFFLLVTVSLNQAQKKFTSRDNLIVINFVGLYAGNRPF